MKMVKKILIGAVAVAMLALVGCKQSLGLGKFSGTKYNGTMTIDATDENKDKCDATYRRYIKQISAAGVDVGKFKLDVSVNPENLGNSTIGIAFDFSKSDYVAKDATNGDVYKIGTTTVTDEDGNAIVLKDGDTVYDFVLLGFKAATNQFYFEHYYDVPKAVLKAGMDTNFGAMGNYYTNKGSDQSYKDKNYANVENDYFSAAGAVTTNEDGWKQFTITVDQTPVNAATKEAVPDDATGVYSLKLGTNEVLKYTSKNVKWKGGDLTATSTGSYAACGDVYIYGNAYAGNKVEAKIYLDKTVEENKDYVYNKATNPFALLADEEYED